MEIALALADGSGQIAQGQLFIAVFDQPASPNDDGSVCLIAGWAVRVAPPTRAKARRLRAFKRVVQLDILGIGDA